MTTRDPADGRTGSGAVPSDPGRDPDPELVSPATSPPESAVRAAAPGSVTDPDDDLPVVARLVVEIRSDGRRTVARGAIEDVDGNRAAVRARGDSPLQLAWALARSLLATPRIVTRTAVRSLLPGRRRRGGR